MEVRVLQITRADSLADSGKILKESIIRELYEDAERQLKETLSAHQRELFEKFLAAQVSVRKIEDLIVI